MARWSVVLQPGEFNPTIDAGVWRPASLGNTVWHDQNGDGQQDPNEPPMPGVTVVLYNGVGTPIMTATTTITGFYQFNDLIPSVYSVGVLPPGDYIFTRPGSDPFSDTDSNVNPNTGRTAPVTLVPGENNPTIDAGLVIPASLGDRVWHDTNSDGVQDAGELGVPGVQVVLYDAVHNTPVATTTTDANGLYHFINLRPGDYSVQFNLPAGYVRSPQDQGSNDVTDSDADPVTGRTIATNLASGENDPTWDAGIYQLAALGDRVWLDIDGDGVQDAGEPGVQGVPVVLYHAQRGIPVLTTTTDATGFYGFDALNPGQPYTVVFGLPSGYSFTAPNVGGNDAADSDADRVTGVSQMIVLQPGEHNPTVDAGLWQSAGLGNYVWLDFDKDGVQDINTDEMGVGGVSVTLYQGGVAISTTLTGDAGYYSFTQLTPGVPYTVQFSLPDGFVWTEPGANPSSGTDSNVNVIGATGSVILQSGEFNPTIDAGVYSPVVIDKHGAGSGPQGTLGNDRLITYTLTVINISDKLVSKVVISDPLPSELEWVVGSASPTPAGTQGNILRWNISQLEGKGQRVITFVTRVTIDTNDPVFNVAYVLRNIRVVASDEAEVPTKPTAVTLARFEVTKMSGAAGVRVLWETSLEQDTYGFNVLRAEHTDRSSAVQVTSQLIAATGRNGGASYEFIDTSVDASKSYVYWLQEIELSGALNEYGPITYGDASNAAINSVVKPLANIIGGGVAVPAILSRSGLPSESVNTPQTVAVIESAVAAVLVQEVGVAPVVIAPVPAMVVVAVPDTRMEPVQPTTVAIQPTQVALVTRAVAPTAVNAPQPKVMPIAKTQANAAPVNTAAEARPAVQAVIGASQPQSRTTLNGVTRTETMGKPVSKPAETSLLWMWLLVSGALLITSGGVVVLWRRRRG